MTNHHTRIIYQESPRDHRTEIPNIVFIMREKGLISNSDFLLYCTYRQIAGENGGCWYGTRALVKKSGLSHTTITKSKKNLSQSFDILEGKSLIYVTACDRKKEEADTITITDIWHENHNFFKNLLTCAKIRYTGVQNKATRVCKNKIQNKEPYKKEPIIIAEQKEDPPPDRKQMPAGGNNNFFECLNKCYDLSDRQKRLLMKYPESVVDQAVRYAYHPTTQIQGGPVGRIKLLQYFVKNPEEFAQSMEDLDKPRAKISKKDTILGRFKNGEIYNGYEFSVDDIGVGFYKSGMMQPYSVYWKSRNFTHEFLQLLKKCGIDYDSSENDP